MSASRPYPLVASIVGYAPTTELPPLGFLLGLVISLQAGNGSRKTIEAMLLGLRSNSNSTNEWSDFKDCLALILDRVESQRIEPFEAATLLRNALQVG